MNSAEFRKELMKIMPGYNWTIHQTSDPKHFQSATGIQSSGFNRLSTLRVERTERNGEVWYEAKSAGYGVKAPWKAHIGDRTLARALRGLQTHYQCNAEIYRELAARLEEGRKVGAVQS